MDSSAPSGPHLAEASKRLAHQALIICENRIELLLVEIQEERERILHAFWLSLALAVFALLTGTVITLLITVACWNWSPVAALSILAVLYAGTTAFLTVQLNRLRRDWETLPDTFNELRKDRECLEKKLH